MLPPAPVRQRSAQLWSADSAIVLFVFIATLLWRFLTFTGFTNDHYAHLALAQQLLLGDRPIRDFSDPGWPLTYLLSAAAWRVDGGTLGAEWTIVALSFALGSAFTWIAARNLSGSRAVAFLVTALEVLIYPRTYSYPKVLMYGAGGLALLALAARPSRARIFGMAAVIAIAFLFRHDHGLFIGIAAAICLMAASRQDGWQIATRRTAELTGATAGFLLPWIAFVSLNGGLVSYFQEGIDYSRYEAQSTALQAWPSFHVAPQERLLGLRPPLRPLAQVEWTAETTIETREELERHFGLEYVRDGDDARMYYAHNTDSENLRALAYDVHVKGTSGLSRLQRPAWREFLAVISPFRLSSSLALEVNAEAWLFWIYWMLPVACVVVGWRRFRQGREQFPGELAAIAGLVVMAVFVNATFLRNALAVRLPDAIVPHALLGAWAIAISLNGQWQRRTLQRSVQLATVMAVTVSALAVWQMSSVREMAAASGLGSSFEAVERRATEVRALLKRSHRDAAPSRYSQAMNPFFQYLDRCTSVADRLVVTGEFPDVEVAAGRRFASDGVVFGSWYSSQRYQDRTVQRLRARPPLFAIHMSNYQRFQERYTLVDQYLNDGYEQITEIPVDGARPVRILVDRSRTSVGTDSETGWPCFVN
ncbi:MAG: hypothetical protein HOP16_02100 [Acidobacteria bacterium]|nr:hypothetical protein [Acidobacteriota bacterium]